MPLKDLRNKGFAFATFSTVESAQQALGSPLPGTRIMSKGGWQAQKAKLAKVVELAQK
jgi:hypothetical protein